MTFEDDFIQIEFQGGTRRYFCSDMGLDWPPPEKLNFMSFEFVLDRRSQLTDEQRKEMLGICRGAVYVSEN